MNLDKKLELAHEYAIAMIMGKIEKESAEKFATTAFDLADAMEAEAEKRIKAKAKKDAKDAKVFFEKLNSTDSSQLEFQVDWSVAPEWADWWLITSKCKSIWVDSEPRISDDCSYWCIPRGNTTAPSFNYQGDWKDSLRKRP